MEKLIRDDQVGIIYSPSYGAGWYTWNDKYPQLIFHPKLIELIESNQQHKINNELVRNILGITKNSYIYLGAVGELQVRWIPVGTVFMIDQYDGNERIEFVDKLNTFTA